MKTEEKIIETFFDFSRSFKGVMMNSCKENCLTILQIHVLSLMNDNKEINVSNVADHLMVTMPTATNIIDKLVEQGLVIRKTNENDRRNILLSLTDKGRDALATGKKIRSEAMRKILSNLSFLEKISLLKILNKLKSTYEK